MPNVSGIIETAIYADDVNITAAFYQKLFGFKALLESPRLIALDVAGKSVLLIFQAGATDEPLTLPGGTIPGHSGSGPTHFAFAISSDEVEPWQKHLADENVPIESVVNWPAGAVSIYFRDPDRHVVELLTQGFWATY